MNLMEKITLKNGLCVLVDWLSFTLTSAQEPSSALDLLGFSMDEFYELPSGQNGYASCLKCLSSNLRILYNGNENMGVHVIVSGSAISDLLTHYCKKTFRPVSTPFGSHGVEVSSFDESVLSSFLKSVLDVGKFSRIDLAVDNLGELYFDMDELANIFNSRLYVSKSRSWKYIVNHDSNYITGQSIYLGSRSSDLMLRIYDKRLEQQSKHKNSNAPVDDTPWVRWEIELKDERAGQVTSLLANGMNLGSAAVGILGNYIRLIDNTDSRRTRCQTLKKWEEFICGISTLRLYQKPANKTINDTHEWLKKQVAPSLSAVCIAFDGDMQFIYDLLSNGGHRLNKHQRAMVQSYRRIKGCGLL